MIRVSHSGGNSALVSHLRSKYANRETQASPGTSPLLKGLSGPPLESLMPSKLDRDLVALAVLARRDAATSALASLLMHPARSTAFSMPAPLPRPGGIGGTYRPVSPPSFMAPKKREAMVMFMDCDEDSLSEYQCLIRKQMELFEANAEEANASVQGRNKKVVLGQVGIRCRHCQCVPAAKRERGAMYFPTKLDRIYQAAQNLSTFHLVEHCKHVPEDVRLKIKDLRERKSPAGGGKRYWAESVRCLGVKEDITGLRFA